MVYAEKKLTLQKINCVKEGALFTQFLKGIGAAFCGKLCANVELSLQDLWRKDLCA